MGDKDNVNVGLAEPLYLTLPKGDIPKLSAVVEMQQDLSAPIEQGAVVGQVMYKLEDQVIAEASLVAQEPVEQGSIFKRLLDWVKKLFASLF
ncbi:D-alanyl-D-alanine carboxypeptidase [Vibrio astriarenae]|nr:D-alanyl-D-alanine carboxypeptidase [Vibrio sp. C7]